MSYFASGAFYPGTPRPSRGNCRKAPFNRQGHPALALGTRNARNSLSIRAATVKRLRVRRIVLDLAGSAVPVIVRRVLAPLASWRFTLRAKKCPRSDGSDRGPGRGTGEGGVGPTATAYELQGSVMISGPRSLG